MAIALENRLYKMLPGDSWLWAIWGALAIASLFAVYSSAGTLAYNARGGNTEYFLIRQFIFLVIGFCVTYYFAKGDYRNYGKWSIVLLFASMILLGYTIFFGTEYNDARRWINIPLINQSFQTSDLAKVALILYVAKMISLKQDVIKDLKNAFVPIICPVLAVCIFIAPSDLSTAAALFFTCLVMMFVGRININYILVTLVLGAFLLGLLFILGYYFPDSIRSQTWISRVSDFFGSEQVGYQIQQAKIAIAHGDWSGVGPGNSIQRNFLPSAYADFIYAIICEEWGLIGAFMVIFVYLFMMIRCVILVTNFDRTFGSMLVLGMMFSIVFQAYLNIAVSVDLMPVTGLTLPMISMGGTSLLFTCCAFGMIISVSEYYKIQRMNEDVIDE